MRPTALAHSRERTVRVLSRAALLVALTIAAAAASCATARAGSVQFVRVTGTGPSGSADLSQLPGKPPFDVVGGTYGDVITTVGGAPTTVTVPDGYSLGTLLTSLGIGSSTFTYIEVAAPDGRTLLLTATQAASSAAFPDGPPVVWQDGAGAHFLLPSLPGGGAAFAGQTFSSPSITIELHSGTLLSVGITSAKAYVGRPVQFTSVVSGGAALTDEWSFGDGGIGSTALPVHTYTAPGTYDVYLKVTGGGDSIGESSVLAVVVGQPPRAPSRPGGGTGVGGQGIGAGTGQGSGSGSGPGAAAVIPVTPVTPPAPRPVRVKPPKTPPGPLVSGILVADASSAASGGGHGAASQAARGAHASSAAALAEWFWIVVAALAMLLGGAVLEWAGSPRMTAILGITPRVEAYSRER